MASATPTAAMNAASATSRIGAAVDFLRRGGTRIVGRGLGRRLSTSVPEPTALAGAAERAGGGASNGFLRARGGGERCSVVRASSSGGAGSNGLRRRRALGDGAIGDG